ncbi:MAG TPA: 4-hydroxythreonine-4-phosphate dehydrogenase PdxA [Chlorobiota bacterium]|nr:4-hydroxythreonine-4-phosphate dehydrogenase PdxA [Chlorobiota bacterium]
MNVVVSCGDVNGIGLLCLQGALRSGLVEASVTLCSNPAVLESSIAAYGLSGRVVEDGSGVIWTDKDFLVRVIPLNESVVVQPGVVAADSGAHAISSLTRAIDATGQRTFDALLTLPVNKEANALAGWSYPGQTEMLGDLRSGTPLMVLCTETVRVALVSVHVPLRHVANVVTKESITTKVQQFNNWLRRDMAIQHPRIAVLSLDPHAGEHGHIGDDDDRTVLPAVRALTATGIAAAGPFPADGFFGFGAYEHFDGIVAMYHDQGLIPLKLLARGAGVNVTAGLDIVRVSPDHGTAFDLAVLRQADVSSTIEAFRIAAKIVRNRTIV